jgi:hypothetical protein
MSQAIRTTAANWTRRPASPEVVRAIANAAAVGEIAIRKAANSAGGRALASVVREYPLWSVFIASTIGYLLAGGRRSAPKYVYSPLAAPRPAPAPAAKTKP